MSVIVLEKDSVARHASGVNAGGVRRLGGALPEVPISERSKQIWYRIGELLDDDIGFQIAPQIKIAETEAELDGLRARAAELQSMGFGHEEILDAAELRRPLSAVAEHAVCGLAALRDGFAQPYWTTRAFQRKAATLGVRFVEQCRALSVVRVGGDWVVETSAGPFRAPRLLNAAGAWCGALAAMLGEHAPVEAIAPIIILTNRLPAFCNAVVGATGRLLSFKQMPNVTVVIGGGRLGRANPARNLWEILFPELQCTTQTAVDLFPIMRSAVIVRSWSGVEGRMPDDIPVIGPSAHHDGLWHAFGFSAHDFQMGPGAGEIMLN